MLSLQQRWLVPESELPADPEQRRSAISMERNSDWQAEIAEYRSQLEAERSRCAERLREDEQGSCGGAGSGGKPSSDSVCSCYKVPSRGSHVMMARSYCPPSFWQASARGVARCSLSFAKRQYGLS